MNKNLVFVIGIFLIFSFAYSFSVETEFFKSGKIYKLGIPQILDMLPSDPSGSLDESFLLEVFFG